MKSARVKDLTIYAPKSRDELIDFAFNKNSILVAVNAEKILNSDTITKDIINRNIGYPDGIGAILALRKKKIRNIMKIPGCELWLEIISKYYKTKSFYLVGGKQKVIEKTVNKLSNEFVGINICNFRNGYLRDKKEEEELIDDIIKHNADIIFVAMGSPKQEYLMDKMQKKHRALYQGLGGSFDVYVGSIPRAPKWFINNNMEWAFRLIRQPSRIIRQFQLIRFYILVKLNLL